jgi:hypothetical protein
MGNKQSAPRFTSANTDPRAPPPPPPPPPPGPAQPPGPPFIPVSQSFNPFTIIPKNAKELQKEVDEHVAEFQKQQPAYAAKAGLYKAAIDIFAQQDEKFWDQLAFAEQGQMMLEDGTRGYVPLPDSAIRPYINPKMAEFRKSRERITQTEMALLGINPEWTKFMQENIRKKVDVMYNGIRDKVNQLLAKAKDLQAPVPIQARDPHSIEARLERINAMGGRKTRHRKRKHKRKTRR